DDRAAEREARVARRGGLELLEHRQRVLQTAVLDERGAQLVGDLVQFAVALGVVDPQQAVTQLLEHLARARRERARVVQHLEGGLRGVGLARRAQQGGRRSPLFARLLEQLRDRVQFLVGVRRRTRRERLQQRAGELLAAVRQELPRRVQRLLDRREARLPALQQGADDAAQLEQAEQHRRREHADRPPP